MKIGLLITAVLWLILSMISIVFAKDKEGVLHDYPITRVIDGDTVAFQADFLPDPLKKELSIRVYGVDTPEKGWRGQCDSEKELGAEASAFTKGLVENAKKTQVVLIGWDKFGGRVLGDVIFDGQSLREQLLSKGYAREYYGDKKESWCK